MKLFFLCVSVSFAFVSMSAFSHFQCVGSRQLVVEYRAVLIEESVDPSTKTVSGGRKLSCAYAECCWNILGARHVFLHALAWREGGRH